MNSRWQASKIGLVNFWYYDEQEFPFVKGRMLLRGSNGSGKSVTMQSVVPLLLDGNMSPERLDPFGSRDRKMSSYLLEEDDEREERTGYLYLEFKRQDSETYLTIGMGIRARKGKPLDKWYFSLSDGRRIGKDFFLYRETDEKVPLTKRELQNRLLGGGMIFDRQADYMEYVNKQIFGFDTVEEYREMIDLLIQLRTPKLSKDFKPSIINEILSNSLQPLSDDDLRPMSEAIENIDTMSLNLKTKQEAKQAADKIAQSLDRYNRFILFEKAHNLEVQKELLSQTESQIQQYMQEKEACEKEAARLEEESVQMDAMKASMEKERETLNKSDAVALKDRELVLSKELTEHQEIFKRKKNNLTVKEDQYLDLQNRKKLEENVSYEKETQIKDLLEEMSSQAEDMAFEEHTFMQDELLSKLEEIYSFSLHRQQFETTKTKIRQGTQMLRRMQGLEREKDALLQKSEKNEREKDSAQKKENELDAMLVQLQSEWKEALYAWNGKNEELIVDSELLHEFCAFADGYQDNSDFSIVQQKVGDAWILAKDVLKSEASAAEREEKEVDEQYRAVKNELYQWENQKESEPERSEMVKENRKRLAEKHIPYCELYKLIEFDSTLDETACNHLEEALLLMGILDALVVDEQYKDEVLAINNDKKDCCDRYLFVTKKRIENSLLDVLELGASANDIFMNQRLTSILGQIAWIDSSANVTPKTTVDASTAIWSNGIYQLGPVTGTITGTYTAKFIGAQARERNRQQKIEECKEILSDLEAKKELLAKKKQKLTKRQQKLLQEYQTFPKDNDLKEALKMLELAAHECERLQAEALRIEEERKKMSEQLNERKKEALVLAQELYLECSLNVFEQAEEAAFSYGSDLLRVESLHELYLNSQNSIRLLEEDLKQKETDLDELRYDAERENKNLKKIMQELDSAKKQLELTDYEQIQDRLDRCIIWLNEYPDKMKKCEREKTQKKDAAKQLEESIQTNQMQAEKQKRNVSWLNTIFEAERDLCYVSFSLKDETKTLDSAQIVSILSGTVKQNREVLVKNLNQIFFENKAYLSEYHVEQTNIFEEMDKDAPQLPIRAARADFTAKYKNIQIPFMKLITYLAEEIEVESGLLRDEDRKLFEDILANTMGRKIRAKINSSNAWVEKMNSLMNAMNTSSGLKLSLRWRSKTAESEDQLDTKELVELLRREASVLNDKDFEKLSKHFRSKVEQARRSAKDSAGMVSFYQVMKDTLDYRKWFEFQLFSQKNNERKKELTNSVFGTFSGGEKAMSMYVPLFSAVVAKYQGGRSDAPRLISLDEAFAGVDSRNIRDMFRLMSEFEFDFIINSQVLWGDSNTLDALAIYQLIRPENAKFVSVMPYLWNGYVKKLLENEEEVELEGAELTATRE